MSLAPGSRLGPYEIVALIGVGGMGEVYKARDTRLDRTIAIKILPITLAADPQFRDRFDREARAIAALTHPHICTVYDVGHQDDTAYLVMEYLEGETLAHRLEKGAVSLDQALRYAIEIADALDKAHRAGIVHRDLKPGNIMLTKSGATLLDFGLAKTAAPVIAGAGVSMLPTTPPNLTAQGTILGTFQYMAPEQLEGKEADARTDLFAFGAVIYEMLTGKKPFEGTSQASLISAIMKDEPPPISATQPLTPPALDWTVKRCLAKEPNARWQTAIDLLEALRWIAADAVRATPAVAPASARWRERAMWLITTAAVLVATAIAVSYVRRPAPTLPLVRLDVTTPASSDPTSFALSPDGRQLVFAALAEGVPKLWVRPLDETTARPLAGTEGASYPFWSPDGRAIGFFADSKLKRIDVSGGTPQVLADAPNGRGGTWSGDGVILFTPTNAGSGPADVLMHVSAVGGTPMPVTHLAAGQASHRWPQFLPDGRRFLFLSALGRLDTNGVYLGSLDGREPIRLLPAESAALFAPPTTLLVVRQGVLRALPFDPDRGTISGDGVPVADAVGTDSGMGRSAFSVSPTGVLAYRSVGGSQRRQLVWVDRMGKVQSAIGPPDENGLANPALASDGQRVAVNRSVQGNGDIWLMDLGRGVPRRLTFDAAFEGRPVWSPDGNHVVFNSSRKGVYDLFEKPANGATDEQPLLVTSQDKFPLDWSPDGRLLLYATQDPTTASDLWALPLTGERTPFPVVQTRFDDIQGQFSPDGRWLAFASNETGRYEIYIRSFPEPGGKWMVSTAGGTQPRWRRDGTALYYVAPDTRLMAVPIRLASDTRAVEAGVPVSLFPTRLATGANVPAAGSGSRAQYAVAPDGRLLMNVAADDAVTSPITIVQNWTAGLKK